MHININTNINIPMQIQWWKKQYAHKWARGFLGHYILGPMSLSSITEKCWVAINESYSKCQMLKKKKKKSYFKSQDNKKGYKVD